MPARVDLHFHLLPGVDDGPATMEESVDLARAALAEGTGAVVATPHVREDFVTDVSDLPGRLREVRDRLARERIPLRILSGAELGHEMVGRLGQRELESIAIGPPRGRWLLLEAPFEGIGPDLHDAAEELRDRGFGVVLAHPERSADLLAEHEGSLRMELDRGTALQVNATSLTGAHGPAARRAAVHLVGAGLAEAVASDAHSAVRGPALELGIGSAIENGVPEAIARRSTDLRPLRLLSRGLARPAPVAAP